MPISRTYPRETTKTIPTDQITLSILPFLVKTGSGELFLTLVKICVGEVFVREVFFGECAFVKFAVREISVVERDVPNSKTAHSRRSYAEFASEVFVSKVKSPIVVFRWTFGKSVIGNDGNKNNEIEKWEF